MTTVEHRKLVAAAVQKAVAEERAACAAVADAFASLPMNTAFDTGYRRAAEGIGVEIRKRGNQPEDRP